MRPLCKSGCNCCSVPLSSFCCSACPWSANRKISLARVPHSRSCSVPCARARGDEAESPLAPHPGGIPPTPVRDSSWGERQFFSLHESSPSLIFPSSPVRICCTRSLVCCVLRAHSLSRAPLPCHLSLLSDPSLPSNPCTCTLKRAWADGHVVRISLVADGPTRLVPLSSNLATAVRPGPALV